ncbi:MAG: 50S ribosomal protein L24 [Ignavibacteria bacterium]|nr:50S ribosomal protein L24 [Ignavibacteria bacterium]
MRVRIKKNDNVIVIAGNARGKKGKVLKVFPRLNRVIVEGVNIVQRHTRPTQKNPQGGILKKEAPIHISNVMLLDPKTGERTRIGSKIIVDDRTNKKKIVRVSVKSKEMI